MFSVDFALFHDYCDFIQMCQGFHSFVYKATHKNSGRPVIIKGIFKSTLASEEVRDRFIDKMRIMKQVDHPYIAQIFDFIDSLECYYILMEYVDGITLQSFIDRNGKLKDPQRIFCQIASAVVYLHKLNVEIRCLSLENILLDSEQNVSLIGLVSSESLDNGIEARAHHLGSLIYIPPEEFMKRPPSEASDIWCLGIIFYSMVFGEPPFADLDLQRLARKIVSLPLEFPTTIPKYMEDLISRLLAKDAAERIQSDQIVQHPYVSEIRYSHYLTDAFLTSPKYKILPHTTADLDKDVAAEMQNQGYQISGLFQELSEGIGTERCVIYRILRRVGIIQMLSSQNEIREMYKLKHKENLTKPIRLAESIIRTGKASFKPLSMTPIPRADLSTRSRTTSFELPNHKKEGEEQRINISSLGPKSSIRRTSFFTASFVSPVLKL